MARTILIASGKGGVGKTTVTANLGLKLAKEGYRTLLIDGDIGLNNLDVALGVEDKVVYDIIDVIEGRAKIKQALVEDNEGTGLKLLPSAKAHCSDRVKAGTFTSIVTEAQLYADYVLIDAPAGVELGFHRTACSAREAIIVTTPHVSAVKDADRVLSLLGTYDIRGIGLVVNRVRGDLEVKGETLDARSIAELLRLPLYGVIPESDRIGVYSTISNRMHDKASIAYDMLKDVILKRSEQVYDCTRNRFLGRFFR